jgi:hypothetical protein
MCFAFRDHTWTATTIKRLHEASEQALSVTLQFAPIAETKRNERLEALLCLQRGLEEQQEEAKKRLSAADEAVAAARLAHDRAVAAHAQIVAEAPKPRKSKSKRNRIAPYLLPDDPAPWRSPKPRPGSD